MQTHARHIGSRVQVLNFLSHFSMGNFKNRLAATKPPPLARTLPEPRSQAFQALSGSSGPLGAHRTPRYGHHRRAASPQRTLAYPCVPWHTQANPNVPGHTYQTLAYPGTPNKPQRTRAY